MRKEGSVKVKNSIFHYWLTVHKENSLFGIDGGKITLLTLKRNGEVVSQYARGWNTEPTEEDAKVATTILIQSDN